MVFNGTSFSCKWVILGLITLTHVMNAYSGQSIQPLAPFLQSELHLKHFQIGMFTSIFFLGAFSLSIPMGWLVDRVGVYWTMAVGQLIVGLFILSGIPSGKKSQKAPILSHFLIMEDIKRPKFNDIKLFDDPSYGSSNISSNLSRSVL